MITVLLTQSRNPMLTVPVIINRCGTLIVPTALPALVADRLRSLRADARPLQGQAWASAELGGWDAVETGEDKAPAAWNFQMIALSGGIAIMHACIMHHDGA